MSISSPAAPSLSESEEEEALPSIYPIVTAPRTKKRVRKIRHISPDTPISEDPLILFLLSILSGLKRFFLWLWNSAFCTHFQMRDLVNISIPEFFRIVIAITIFLCASRIGVHAPARIDGYFWNRTRDAGFSPTSTTFDFVLSTIQRANDRFFVYGQFFRRQIPNSSKIHFPPGMCKFDLTVKGISRFGSSVSWKKDLGNVNLSIGNPDRSPSILLLYRSFPVYTDLFLNLTITGNAASFDTFQLTVLTNEHRFSRIIQFYRLMLALFVLNVFLNRRNYSKRQNFVAFVIFVTFVPTGFLNWVLSSSIGLCFVIDCLLFDVFTLFLYYFWLFEYSGAPCRYSKQLFVFASVPVFAIVVYDSIWRSVTEFMNPLKAIRGPLNVFDSAIVPMYIGMFVIAYFLFTMRPRNLEDLRIDGGTFAFFVAMVCHILDEYAVRMRVLSCQGGWRHLRTLEEVAAVWLLAYQNPQNDETCLEVEKDFVEEYEYEYEEVP